MNIFIELKYNLKLFDVYFAVFSNKAKMVQVEVDQINKIGAVLNDKNRPLKERFRALFTLKNIGGQVALENISRCFEDDSALLKHELAYCMGQMQDSNAIPFLIKVLEDKNQEPMVNIIYIHSCIMILMNSNFRSVMKRLKHLQLSVI